MSGSKETTQTATQKQEPWGAQQPYLKSIMQEAQNLYQGPGQEFYPGSTTVPFAPETQQSIAMQTARARTGSPVTQAAKSNVLTTLAGGNPNPYMGGLQETAQTGGRNPYMTGLQETAQTGGRNPYMAGLQETAAGAGTNPYLDSIYRAAARPVEESFRNAIVPSIASRFARAGRYGSGAMKDQLFDASDVLARNLAGMGANIYGSGFEAERGRQYGAQGQLAGLGESQLGRQYGAQGQLAGLGEGQVGRQVGAQSQLAGLGENELGRQFGAAQFAPTLAATDYGDIAQLQAAGRAREDLGERQIAENIARHNFEQQAQANKLAQFLRFVQGDYGVTETASKPIYRNPAAGGLGGGLAGAQIGGLVGIPFGAGIGAIGGGLLGAFG